jgi:protein-S-isoprenylcysteine O-methyltransferase Ste14
MLPLAYANNIYRLGFWIAFAIWLIPELIGTPYQRIRGNAQIKDRGSRFVLMAFVWGGVVLALSLPAIFPSATIVWHRTFLFSVGIALMLVGVALRWYSIRVLGRYFTRRIAIQPGHQVVRAGPYRYIRHPSYSGALLTILGMCLTMTNWVALWVPMACALAGYSYRAMVEERALRESVGEPYAEYMQHTRRFIPFVF